MRFQTKKSQLDSIVLLLGELVKRNQPEDIAQKLVHSIVKKVYLRLLVKTETATRSGFTFTLSDPDALALFVFINQVDLMIEFYPCESNEIQMISNQIHQAYV